MKKTAILFFMMIFAGSLMAEAQKTTMTIKIKTSAQCEMCKEKIERALAYEKGVVSSELDMETKEVEVKYKTKKTSPEKIKKAISVVGYDAGEVKADAKAYSKLEACCKKPEDR